MSQSIEKAALIFSCQDQVGIIADLGTFFAKRDLNILRYEEFVDDGRFFSRLEWTLNDRWDSVDEFSHEFSELAQSKNANFDVHFMKDTQSLGLFVSKQPHALIQILNKQEAGFFPKTDIGFIVSNSKASEKIAQRHDIPFYFISTKGDRKDFEAKQLEIIQRYQPSCIGLARYMKVLSEDFLSELNCPIVNIHHSFLPSFVGARPYHMAYEKGVKLIGATSHFVTPELDQGPIIEQDVTRVRSGMSIKDMMKMGQDIEQRVFATAIQKVLEHKTIVYKNRTLVFN